MTDFPEATPGAGQSLEAHPAAAAILQRAGWTAHPEWGVYTRGTLVMGGFAGTFYVKDFARIPPGHPLYSADTPDTAEEAAAWLVHRFALAESGIQVETPAHVEEAGYDHVRPEGSAQEADLWGDGRDADGPDRGADEGGGDTSLEAEFTAEVPGAEVDESDGETGEASGARAGDLGRDFADQHADEQHPADRSALVEGGGDGEAQEAVFDPIDADFTIEDLGGPDEALELPAPPPEDFIFDELAEEVSPQDRFIGLDDLDRRRSLRIGDTIRYANSLMPAWSIDDDARLAYLRNFAMGVSEKRWDDNAANQAELNALETTIRRINEIKNARDAKVEFLEGASREEVEDFAVEADWP